MSQVLEGFYVSEAFAYDLAHLLSTLLRILVQKNLDNMAFFSLEAQTLSAKLFQSIVQSEMISKRRNNNCTILLLATDLYRGLSETLS